jgi:predicted transcriptional regulator
MPKSKDAVRILNALVKREPKLQALVAAETVNAQVARMINDSRTKAGLTQLELAKLVGTTQSVIARLEDADYSGHSLTMLNRIAEALHKRLDIRLVSAK